MADKQTLEVLVQHAEAVLRDASSICSKWATESRKGGWSTHQIKANLELAAKLENEANALAAKAR